MERFVMANSGLNKALESPRGARGTATRAARLGRVAPYGACGVGAPPSAARPFSPPGTAGGSLGSLVD